MLLYVESGVGYLECEDRDGNTVYLASDGSGRRLVDFGDLDLGAEWNAFPRNEKAFLGELRTRVINPDRVDDINFCVDCAEPHYEADLRFVSHGMSPVCESCLETDYFYCESCEDYKHWSGMVTTLYDTRICAGCYESYYRYCDYCAGIVADDDYEHDHDENCDCEAPAQSFTFAGLPNDVRLGISLPAGVISDEGIGEIARLIRVHANTFDVPTGGSLAEARETDYHKWNLLSRGLSMLDAEWQTKQGNYTKRLSRHAYKAYGIKVPADLLTKIGNVARQHSDGRGLEVEVTRNLNLPAEDFVHSDSCWWQSYASSRCALKSNGGFGLRSWQSGSRSHEEATGRAWVMPLRVDEHGSLTATFDAQSADAYVVFNGYGDLSGYAAARVVAQMTGMTYRKIGFEADPMYINAGGYLIAPEDIKSEWSDVQLYLEEHSDLYRQERRGVPAMV